MTSSHLFHLTQVHAQNQSTSGKRIKATKSNFKTLQGMAFYWLTLSPKGVREPHWHANADELGYCIKGKVAISMYGNDNLKATFIVNAGEAFYVPSGFLHDVENLSEEASELILQFSNEEPEDFGLSSAFGMFSDAVLGNTWGVTSTIFHKMKRSTQEVFSVLQKTTPHASAEHNYSSPYRFNLQASSPLIANSGGEAKVARKDVWPILKRQALYSLVLTGTGMREPHWHPETAELGFVHRGKGRMSILSPNGKVDTYEMNEGDLYFIPKAYPHHIENLTNGSLNLLIFFDQAMPGDIGFTGSVKSYSNEVLAAVLNSSTELFSSLPTYYTDAFIVKKINPVD